MKFLKNLYKKLEKRIETRVETKIKKEIYQIFPQILEFYNAPDEDKSNYYDYSNINNLENQKTLENLVERYKKTSIPVEEAEINIAEFEEWLKEFKELRNYYVSWGDVFIEKCLEHYLTYKYLNISKREIVIDVASDTSNFASLLNKKGIKSYQLDLSYPEGIRDRKIGADAGNTGLSAKFASVLTLHCAYECFAGDADIRFVKEAERILKDNGSYAIVPLYTDQSFNNVLSPFFPDNKKLLDDKAKLVWREDGVPAPFSRHYSPEIFEERIYKQISDKVKAKIIYFNNIPELVKFYKNQRIYCYFMFYCQK